MADTNKLAGSVLNLLDKASTLTYIGSIYSIPSQDYNTVWSGFSVLTFDPFNSVNRVNSSSRDK
uniref:Uncharacterized protein n=1 Tax=Planktothrix pseudagardhii TaxID=132604 RepID=A0A9W4G438_9CYAN|nr:hypothetical protein NO713_01785 [Planktothrix pseudagardhii]